MLSFLARRLVWSAGVLLLASLLTFFVGYKLPADPARMIAGPNASAETVLSIRHQLGLDQPFGVQYAHFLGGALTGDLGRSYRTEQQVLPTVLERFPYTLALALSGLAFEVLIGASVGLLAAGTKARAVDGLASTFVMLTLAGTHLTPEQVQQRIGYLEQFIAASPAVVELALEQRSVLLALLVDATEQDLGNEQVEEVGS